MTRTIEMAWVVAALAGCSPGAIGARLVRSHGGEHPESIARSESAPAVIYPVGSYRPGRVPVLLVHGLGSGPNVWSPLIAALRADPVLRERCQFWVLRYPTGYPLPEAAALVRAALLQTRRELDPAGADPALARMVVVGKSTGGNVVKLLVQDSGGTLWNAVFARPIDQIDAAPELRDWLAETFCFTPVPGIERVVFIATPHRGSRLAPRFGGRLASGPLRLGDPIRAVHAELVATNGPELFQPAYQRRPPNTFDNLRESSPILAALAQIPIAETVAYHSIIAALPREGPQQRLTDGIVRYTSAHLDGAVSERLIAASHFCEAHPATIAEVGRILHVHLAGIDAGR